MREWTFTQWAAVVIGGWLSGAGAWGVFTAEDTASLMLGGLMIVIGLVGGMKVFGMWWP